MESGEHVATSRSEGFPSRDIWSLGVMAQGSYQMGRVVGTPSPSPPSLGNSGWHSGQETIFRRFPKVLDSWWKISENGDRGSTQNFAARLMSIVVCSGEPFLKKKSKIKKCILFENMHVLKFQKCQFSRNKSPCGSFRSRLYLFRIYLEGGKSPNLKNWNFDFA